MFCSFMASRKAFSSQITCIGDQLGGNATQGGCCDGTSTTPFLLGAEHSFHFYSFEHNSIVILTSSYDPYNVIAIKS